MTYRTNRYTATPAEGSSDSDARNTASQASRPAFRTIPALTRDASAASVSMYRTLCPNRGCNPASLEKSSGCS